ncbi:ribose 1,5-bisphosphokinase [Marinobacterium sp. YM272]|uniref:ribose 1,5-bisphosphokinase n=1 Tax=Marinobacterium sp. YM272 TaxID=3421654 RepID=UPI003D7F4B76
MAHLFYLMGPSGSGKDSLITGLRHRLGGQSPLLFAHRYITRCWQSGGENHVELSEREFDQRMKSGLFLLHWSANGCRYAVGREVEYWLGSGHSVLVNGSRGHLDQVRQCFGATLVPVLVCVEPEQLRERLTARGRESAEQIEERLERNRLFQQQLEGQAELLDNSGDLEQSVIQLTRLVRRYGGAPVDA